MSELRDEIGRIKKDAKALARLYKAVLQEKEALTEENSRLKARLEGQKGGQLEFENNPINLPISDFLKGATTNPAALKKKLDIFIKEIDACIEHLKG
jgi:hypothetical protein